MKENRALWHGTWGGRMVHVPNSAPDSVLSFVRRKDEDKIFAVFNFSNELQEVHFERNLYEGSYCTFFGDDAVSLDETSTMTLDPWGYQVYVKP